MHRDTDNMLLPPNLAVAIVDHDKPLVGRIPGEPNHNARLRVVMESRGHRSQPAHSLIKGQSRCLHRRRGEDRHLGRHRLITGHRRQDTAHQVV